VTAEILSARGAPDRWSQCTVVGTVTCRVAPHELQQTGLPQCPGTRRGRAGSAGSLAWLEPGAVVEVAEQYLSANVNGLPSRRRTTARLRAMVAQTAAAISGLI
jgi:hypothetical protein